MLAILVSACQPEPAVTQAPAAAPSAEADAFPYHFQAPEGWRSEVVTFPLRFAPELGYEGHGDVRFAPGMFTAGADDFWTYSFVWWLPSSTEMTPERLSTDMNTYFSGLAALIMRSRELDVPDYNASAHFTPSDEARRGASQNLSLKGRVETFDAFTTQSPVALNAHVDAIPCPDHDRLALIFAFSPQPYTHENWRALSEIKAGFHCEKD